MRLIRPILSVLFLIGCASAIPAPERPTSPSPVSIPTLLAAPATYDGQHVLVHGQVGQVLRGRTLEGGRTVTIITLVGPDGQQIRAVTWGSRFLFEGTPVELHGIFRAEFRIDEREQQGIIEIKEMRPLL